MTPDQKRIHKAWLVAELRKLDTNIEEPAERPEPDPPDSELQSSYERDMARMEAERHNLEPEHRRLRAIIEQEAAEMQSLEVAADYNRRLQEEIKEMRSRLGIDHGQSDDDDGGPPYA